MDKPLFWHQGLFLQPQHLQLNDLYNQSNLTPYHKYLHPHLYGVGPFKIEESALSNFSFEINSAEFWFGDKTYAVVGENATIEPRHFKNVWDDEMDALTVYVGLKKFSQSEDNVSIVKKGKSLARVHTRFISSEEPEKIMDLHKGDTPANVQQMVLLLKIFFHPEIEQLGNYELIPVGRIERQGDKIIISDTYAPPCISIHYAAMLHAQITEIFNQILFKDRELETYKAQRGIHNAEFGSKDMVYLLALRSFNRYIPVFAHMLEEPGGHPWDVYMTVKQLIGELSSFTEIIDVLGRDESGNLRIPPYDHNDLIACFSGAAALITELIDEITAGPEYIISLEFDDGYFSAILKPEFLKSSNQYYLVMRTEDEVENIMETLDTQVKVGTTKILPFLVERALPGVGLEPLTVPPQELPRRRDSIYFQIDHHSEQWLRIEKNKNIGLYWNSPPKEVRIELMIVNRR